MTTSNPNKLVGLIALTVVGPFVFAVAAVIALLLGAAAGWAGGLIFPEVFANLAELVFDKPVPAWQIGAMLGFVAGFLRVSVPKRR